MLIALAALSLAAAPSFKIASPGVSYVGLDEKTGDSFVDYFNQQLALNPGISVTSKGEIAALVGLERQKQMFGCSESSSPSCITEIAGAVGADALLVGSLAKTSGGFLVNLKVVSAKDAHAIGIFSSRAKTDEALLDYLGTSARELAAAIHREGLLPEPFTVEPVKPVVTETAPPPGSSGRGVRPWMVAGGASAALLIGAGVTFGLASGTSGALSRGEATTPADFDALRSRGESTQALSAGLHASGVLAGAAAAALYARDDQPSPWIPGAASAGCVAAGVVLQLMARSDAGALASPPDSISSPAELRALRSRGEMAQTASLALLGAGIAGLGATLAMAFTGESPRASLVAGPAGAMVTFSGAFP